VALTEPDERRDGLRPWHVATGHGVELGLESGDDAGYEDRRNERGAGADFHLEQRRAHVAPRRLRSLRVPVSLEHAARPVDRRARDRRLRVGFEDVG